MSDVELYIDPVCPYCWQTSKWLRQVQRLEGLDVGWRFISLKMVNEETGYEGMPEDYPAVHAQGTRLLRVLAAAREHAGNEAVGALYAAIGEEIWERPAPPPGDFGAVLSVHAGALDVRPALVRVGLPELLAAAADDPAHDHVLRQETEQALARAGEDVGTPIVSFDPPDGPAFFGPVISHLPSDEEAVAYYRALELLARWPGFAELKRSLRTLPDVRMLDALRSDAA
ncbi:MAG: DsbA family protein [Nitriliruptoraceae bacterium]